MENLNQIKISLSLDRLILILLIVGILAILLSTLKNRDVIQPVFQKPIIKSTPIVRKIATPSATIMVTLKPTLTQEEKINRAEEKLKKLQKDIDLAQKKAKEAKDSADEAGGLWVMHMFGMF